MKLGEFLTSVPRPTAKPEPVKFSIIGRNTQGDPVVGPAFAAFALVSDADHEAADQAAAAAAKQISDSLKYLPPGLIETKERAHFLLAALRDYDNPVERFAGSADELQKALSRRDMAWLEGEYHTWAEKHYPRNPTAEDRAKVKAEAAGK